MDRIATLVDLLKRASDAYYLSDSPIITDSQFDSLRDELESLDPGNDFLNQVGATVDSSPLQKTKLSIPMGSLKKISWNEGTSEYSTWLGSVRKAIGSGNKIAVQHKLDGLSIELTYKSGKFVRAVTRGDGKIGEDVTHNLKNAQGVVQDIGLNLDFYVRGESVIRIDTWKNNLSDMKNPRNAASGISRRKSDTSQSKYLTFIAFDIVCSEDEDDLFSSAMTWDSVSAQTDWLKAAGFSAVETFSCNENDVENVVKQICSRRDDIPYEIDGCVIKVEDIDLQEKMGEHDGRPYWARAWKFESSSGSAVVENVSWGVGTRGTVDPVANISPCDVMGVTISNVTLHNMDEVDRLGVCIGDTVEVARANDVIPKIIRVITQGSNRKTIECPTCPSCGSSTMRDGPVLRCSNMDNCPGVQFKRIAKWINKREIMYLGESALDKLVSSGHVNCIFDLYMLTVEKMTDAGIGQGMTKKILDEIKKSMDCTLADLLGSLSIDLLGRSQAQNIIDQGFGTLSQWEKVQVSDLSVLDGFGEGSKATRIASGVRSNWGTVRQLAAILNVQEGSCRSQNDVQGTGVLGNKSFCFTGKMNLSRGKIEKLCSENGGQVHSSVRKGLDYLVISDLNSTSSKAKNARKYGIKMITEDQFMEMV